MLKAINAILHNWVTLLKNSVDTNQIEKPRHRSQQTEK
jgi:hypothetical protein